MADFKKPKKVTSWRVCPNCGSRATKLLNLSAKEKPYKCQICEVNYDWNLKDIK